MNRGKRIRSVAGVFGLLALAAAVPALAHHSFAVFDHTRTVTIRGTVRTFQWTNPHAFLDVDVPDDKGNVKPFTIELTSINMLSRAGWRSNMIKAGDRVKAVVAPLLSGQPGGLLLDVTLSDGRKLESPVPGGEHLQANPGNGVTIMDGPTISRRALWLVPSLACVIAVSVDVGAGTQQTTTSKAPDMSGSYERYRGVPGARGSQARDPYSPPPAPPPPLKPSYLKEWQAKQQAVREAEAKGEPLGSNVTYCIPDGMPGMMGGPFPMEILQSKGQVTIIQEAYNQVRRILLDQPQKPIDDVEPGFYGRSVGHWEGDTLVVDTSGSRRACAIRTCRTPRTCASRSASAR